MFLYVVENLTGGRGLVNVQAIQTVTQDPRTGNLILNLGGTSAFQVPNTAANRDALKHAAGPIDLGALFPVVTAVKVSYPPEETDQGEPDDTQTGDEANWMEALDRELEGDAGEGAPLPDLVLGRHVTE